MTRVSLRCTGEKQFTPERSSREAKDQRRRVAFRMYSGAGAGRAQDAATGTGNSSKRGRRALNAGAGTGTTWAAPLGAAARAGFSVRPVTFTWQHEHDRWMAAQPSPEAGAQQQNGETSPLMAHAYATEAPAGPSKRAPASIVTTATMRIARFIPHASTSIITYFSEIEFPAPMRLARRGRGFIQARPESPARFPSNPPKGLLKKYP